MTFKSAAALDSGKEYTLDKIKRVVWGTKPANGTTGS